MSLITTGLLAVSVLAIATALVLLRPSRRVLYSFVKDVWISADLLETKQKLWELRLKVIAAVGVIAGAWWAVHSYNATAERELRKQLWDKQLALYFEATESTAVIATLPSDDPRCKTATERFWQLYFGPLRTVEDDKSVGNAMVSFGRCLTEPGNSGPMLDCTQYDLLQRSLNLAIQCRFSIAANWDRKLQGLNKL